MHFPPKFDRKLAIELGDLVNAAYDQFETFKKRQDWKPPTGYQMVCPIQYRTLLAFDAPDEENTTAFDREIQSLPVSYGLTDTFGQDIPIGFVATKAKKAYLIFRGTVVLDEWLHDINIRMTPHPREGWGQVSDGFLKVYMRCRGSFMDKLSKLKEISQLYIAGHSLGGGLTVLALPDVVASTPFKNPILYNFGCPRVGDKDFVAAYNALPDQTTFRVVNTCDLVTSIPLPVPLPLVPSGYYSHVDTPVDFTLQLDDVGKNHATSTYVEVLKQQ